MTASPAEALAEAIRDCKINGQRLRLTDEYAEAMAGAALAALEKAGRVVVPVEPTAEMFEAMVERDLGGRSMKFKFKTFANQWQRMIELVALAARPK